MKKIFSDLEKLPVESGQRKADFSFQFFDQATREKATAGDSEKKIIVDKKKKKKKKKRKSNESKNITGDGEETDQSLITEKIVQDFEEKETSDNHHKAVEVSLNHETLEVEEKETEKVFSAGDTKEKTNQKKKKKKPNKKKNNTAPPDEFDQLLEEFQKQDLNTASTTLITTSTINTTSNTPADPVAPKFLSWKSPKLNQEEKQKMKFGKGRLLSSATSEGAKRIRRDPLWYKNKKELSVTSVADDEVKSTKIGGISTEKPTESVFSFSFGS